MVQSESSSSTGGISGASSQHSDRSTTPRMRLVKSPRASPARPLLATTSPRRREPVTSRKVKLGAKDGTLLRDRPPGVVERPSLTKTLAFIMIPFRFVFSPILAILHILLCHAINFVILGLIFTPVVYLTLAYGPSWLWYLIRPPISTNVVVIPLRTLATSTCFLANILCPLSFLTTLSDPNSTSKPFWELFSTPEKLDPRLAAVSRELSKEVSDAKDIFDSLQALGGGGLVNGLAYLKVRELGIAFMTGSSLYERDFIGRELIELSGVARNLADEVVAINALSVNTFSWLYWEVSHIVQLLSLPTVSRSGSAGLAAQLDSLMSRLDSALDNLYLRTDAALPIASRGTEQGWLVHMRLFSAQSDLERERDRFPGWQLVLDRSRHFIAGGDPSKLDLISRDLDLTRATIDGINETRIGLERARHGLMAFREQIGSFSASVMGLHLGASEEAGIGTEDEVQILASVVEELGRAVGRAKGIPPNEVLTIEER